MSSPFSMIMPSVFSFSSIFLYMIILFSLPIFSSFRGLSVSNLIKSLSKVFPRWSVFVLGGALFLISSLLGVVSISLVPLSVVGFHFPIFGVGLSMALWVIVTLMGNQFRSLQYKKEYLGDTTLSVGWVLMSILIESMSRGARAVTLGARISVNIMMGGILHSVIGESMSSWGMLGLSVFEMLVVVIQVYVFILLLCFYMMELE